jgi:hypothetical protein
VVLIRTIFALMATLLLLIPASQTFAAVVAEIDRQSIGFGETVQLVVRSDQRSQGASPDTQMLDKDFDILSTSQSTRQSIINGRREISSEWLYTLAPKREGRLIVPSISLAGERTQPLVINVGPASQTSADAAVFLKAELDQTQVYVQQQVLLTLRVYHAVALGRGANLSEPSIPDAIVKKLQDSEYQTRIDGRDYRVFEQKFAIFPQRSGTLEIPPSILTATIPTRRSSRQLLDPFGNNGQTIRLLTEGKTLEVLPQDDRYTGEFWLPANKVSILDDWNGGDTTVQLGDSLTRTVTIMADGLLGAQLPPLPLPEIAGLKIYPDQAVVSDGEGDKIMGSSTQSYAIIATQPGQYTLPEQTLQWWDSQAKQTRTASLPAQVLTVLPGSVEAPVISSTAPATQLPSIPAPSLDDPSVARAPSALAVAPTPWHWWLLTGVLSALWLMSSLLAWRFYRRASIAGAQNPIAVVANTPAATRESVIQACKAGDRQATLEALRRWACQETGKSTLDKALADLGDEQIALQVEQLQRSLYQPASQADIKNALATIETRVKHLHRGPAKKNKNRLAPLYPSQS